MRWQVEHSNVRSSKPLSPGEIRPSPILCLQVGHDGRSTTEMGTRTTKTPSTDPDINLINKAQLFFTFRSEQCRFVLIEIKRGDAPKRDFRCTLNNGHGETGAVGPVGANNGSRRGYSQFDVRPCKGAQMPFHLRLTLSDTKTTGPD